MGAPSLFQRFRQTLGRAWRETGQALDRTALRLASIATTKYDFGDEPTICQDFLSRHRQKFPLLAAGRPVVHPEVAYVAPCATLIGSVLVGKGASIWYGAVLRADLTANAESFNKTDEELLTATSDPVLMKKSAEINGEHEEEESGLYEAISRELVPDGDRGESSFEPTEGPFPLPDPERTPYAGGGIVIGENTNIQDGCILSSRKAHCRIGQGVTVGHLAQIHSATVGDFSLIGMGSIIQEGAIIESESFVAAGAVVGPGVVVKAGGTFMAASPIEHGTRARLLSFSPCVFLFPELWVGNPARKLRDLSENERAKLHFQSSEYVQVALGHHDVMQLGGGTLFEVLDQDDTAVVEEKVAGSSTYKSD